MGTNADTHNWTMCTVRDLGASNSKRDVFIKLSLRAWGLRRRKGIKIVSIRGDGGSRKTVLSDTQRRCTYKLRDWQHTQELNKPDRNPSTEKRNWAQSHIPSKEAIWSWYLLWKGKSVFFNEISITLQSRPYAQELLSNTRQTPWLFVHFVFCFVLS